MSARTAVQLLAAAHAPLVCCCAGDEQASMVIEFEQPSNASNPLVELLMKVRAWFCMSTADVCVAACRIILLQTAMLAGCCAAGHGSVRQP